MNNINYFNNFKRVRIQSCSFKFPSYKSNSMIFLNKNNGKFILKIEKFILKIEKSTNFRNKHLINKI